MYTTVKGYYKNGQVTITEPAPPSIQMSEVMVTFLSEPQESSSPKGIVREAGWLKKWGEQHGLTFDIPDDFNEPLDDLKDYM